MTYIKKLLTQSAFPGSEPLTLAETKLYLRVDGSAEDALIANLITAARMTAEQWLRRSLITQSWKLTYQDFLPSQIRLPMGPVTSVQSVIVTQKDDSQQTISPSLYRLDASHEHLCVESEIAGWQIDVVYGCGYGDSTAVPAPIRQGMLGHIAELYESRGETDIETMPAQTARLYMPYRAVSL
jgi:uncharacterized phiE125 gp8 family phage protein